MGAAAAKSSSKGFNSKGAKVWKRTWVGASIAGALVLILWAASALDSALPVLAATVALLAACIFEVNQMGSLAGRRVAWSLAPGALLAAGTIYVAIWSVPSAHDPIGARELCLSWLVVIVPAVLIAIVLGFALARSSSLFVRFAAVAAFGTALAPLMDVPTIYWFVAAVLFVFVLLRVFAIGAEQRREAFATVVLGALLVISIPGLTVVWMAFDHWGLVALLVMAKVGDTAAYYAGSAIGKHHPFKAISPGKTTEGCAASLVATSLAGVGAIALGWLPSEPYGWFGGVLGGAAVNVAAQASDLLESWLKRRAGVKDSGAWFGPSGGVLDLVDSFFLAVPVALVVWPLCFAFPPVWPGS